MSTDQFGDTAAFALVADEHASIQLKTVATTTTQRKVERIALRPISELPEHISAGSRPSTLPLGLECAVPKRDQLPIRYAVAAALQ